MAVLIQYGCGLSAPQGWTNFDVSPRLRIERFPLVGPLLRAAGLNLFPANVRYGDIVSGLPVAQQSADAVYCSHVLEHVDRSSLATALANTLKILKSGGTFRMIVPDLAWRVKRYADALQSNSPDLADQFIRSCNIGEETPVSGVNGRLRAAFGNSGHRWMYDYAAMEKALSDAGFVNIRKCAFGDSAIPEYALVENEGRFFDEGFPELAIEAKAT